MAMIREAVYGDLKSILELYTQMDHNTVPDSLPYALWEEMLCDPHHHVIVAEENGRIISSCMLDITMNLTHGQQPFATIENVITDGENRKRGLATACLDYAAKIAEQAGCYKITLTTGSKRESTLRFYERAGYNRVDKTAFVRWINK